jgi:hypothetical protein
MGVHKKGGLVGGFDQLRAPDAPTISVSAGDASVTVTITNPSDVGGGSITGYAVSALTGPIEDTTFAVTVVSDGGNKYAIDGSTQATLTLYKGHTYIFDQSDSSNSSHPLRLSTTSNGSHGGGSEYTTGVTTSGTAGSAGAFTKIAIATDAPDTLYYYCTNHSGMGGTANLKTSLQGGASGSSSPITVSSLTNDEAYNVRASAINAFGQSPYSAATSASPAPAIGIRFAGEGGGSNTYLDVIDKISIGSTGNATDFGDTSVARDRLSSGGNSTRGLAAGGRENGTSYVVTIEYITFASASDTTDFGDLTAARRKMASMTSSTRSIFGAGELQTYYGNTDTIDYVTTASTGNATDFGDTSEDRSNSAGFSSATRGVMGGGYGEGASEYATAQDEIFYITMASTGNTSDFGDLLAANIELAGLADATRGVFGGGNVSGRVDVIQYVTIASTGNATDFGDLLAANKALTGNIASSTRGIFCGGSVSGSGRQNVIQYITIQSTGNATDFGDLTTTAVDHAGTASSNASVQ